MMATIQAAGNLFPILEANLIAGVVLGGVFALAAIGLVLVYRVTGVLNFAQGAMGMFSTFVAWKILYDLHPFAASHGDAFKNPPSIGVAVVGALLFSLLLGLALHFGVFRWLRGRSQLVKAVITVGILLSLQSIAALIFGSTQYHEAIRFFDPSNCPPDNTGCFTWVIGNFGIGWGQILVIGVALAMAAGLALFLRTTRIGIAMRAVSDDPEAASLWGVPVDLVGATSWMMGSLVSAIASILLISEGVSFDTVSLTVLVLDALAAALIGGLVSLPLTVLGGFVLGLLEIAPKVYNVQSGGLPKFIAIVVILLALLARSEKSLLRAKA
jgi:branched-chain amino acid transport system permease protein